MIQKYFDSLFVAGRCGGMEGCPILVSKVVYIHVLTQ
jgi:hypothetical protein